MRIISGQFRGKKILEPKDKSTRPLKDLTKESIFNIIQHSNKFFLDLNNSNILDLFSGIGSFGLEALSRNANFVTFAENMLIPRTAASPGESGYFRSCPFSTNVSHFRPLGHLKIS